MKLSRMKILAIIASISITAYAQMEESKITHKIQKKLQEITMRFSE